MGWIRLFAAGLAAGTMALAAGVAQAATLEIVYWGAGNLEWVQIDGRSYTVDDDTVVAKDIYEGSHNVLFGANGTSRTFDVYLSSGNAAGGGNWCISVELESHEVLSEYDCEDMWDYYFGF